MTQPIHLIADIFVAELTKLGDQYKSFRIFPPDHVWTVPYLKYSYRSIYHTQRMVKDFYCSEEEPLEPGNWQIICTTKEVKAMHAPELFGHAMIRDHCAQKTIRSLLANKGLDPNKNYLIIKKVS